MRSRSLPRSKNEKSRANARGFHIKGLAGQCMNKPLKR